MARAGSVIALLLYASAASADTPACEDPAECPWTRGPSLLMKGSTLSRKKSLAWRQTKADPRMRKNNGSHRVKVPKFVRGQQAVRMAVRRHAIDHFFFHAGAHQRNMAMLQASHFDRCVDRPTGVKVKSYAADRYGRGADEVGCSQLVFERGCNDTDYWHTLHANCPLSCHLCQPGGGLPACYPHQCGAGGGPWLTKNDKGIVVIPYFFDDDGAYGDPPSEAKKASLRLAASRWEEVSCIRFVESGASVAPPRVTVTVSNPAYCNTGLGFPGYNGTIPLNLGSCGSTGQLDKSVLHELGHLIGMNHENVRPDATQELTFKEASKEIRRSGPFIQVNWQNIDKLKAQFEVDDMSYMGSENSGWKPYDYQSIMHYNNMPFDNGPPFTFPESVHSDSVGVEPRLSHGDVSEVRDLYQCSLAGGGDLGSASWRPSAWGECVRWCAEPTVAAIGHWQAVRQEWCRVRSRHCARSRSLYCADAAGHMAPSSACNVSERPSHALVEACNCPPASCKEEGPVYLLKYGPGTIENHGVFANCAEALEQKSCTDKTWGDHLQEKCPRSCKVSGCPPPPATTTRTTTTTTPTTQSTTTEAGCRDNAEYRDFTSRKDPCSEWQGYDCTAYGEDSIELVKNCPVSCEMCGAEIPSCRRRFSCRKPFHRRRRGPVADDDWGW